ncbi:MAG: hypothetical protein ACUVWZ_14660 [Anaerolineae bacterium]
MPALLRIVADYQWVFFAVLGLLLLYYLRRALLARREVARSIFKLEREQAHARYSRSVWTLACIILLMAGIFLVSNPLSPASPETPEPTLTVTRGPLVVATLTPTPSQPTASPTPSATPVRPTRPVIPSPTAQTLVTPTPVVKPPACPDPNVRITSPGMNQVVRGSVPIRGSATHERFQYYKIEVAPGLDPGDHEWMVVGQLHYEPVVGGVLETFHSTAYPPGSYTLRLVVVDQTGNFPEPCRVVVVVQH